MQNNRLIDTLLRRPVDRTPIWIMRQAGRYLPEYRQLRDKAGDFMTLCKTPALACEATLQPINRYPLDAAILFSDILTIPDAMGLELKIIEGKGPQFNHPIKSEEDIHALTIPDPNRDLDYVMETVAMVRSALKNQIPLIGFAGSPWTIATYMLEGSGSKTFQKTRKWLYTNPVALHILLDKLTRAITDYLNAQIVHGATVIMLFDSWGGLLSEAYYETFSLAYMRQIIQGLQNQNTAHTVPIILFTKGGGLWIKAMAESGCHAVGLDWTQNIGAVRQKIGHKVALQGNLDPAVLYASPKKIEIEVNKILQCYGHGTGHVFNLGHGISPDVDPEHVAVLVNTVHKLSAKSH